MEIDAPEELYLYAQPDRQLCGDAYYPEEEPENDLRGWDVYDRKLKKFGIVAEVYCSSEDFRACYIEILPFDREGSYLYPVELISWKRQGPVVMKSDAAVVERQYRTSSMLASIEEGLITYTDALDDNYGIFWPTGPVSEDCA